MQNAILTPLPSHHKMGISSCSQNENEMNFKIFDQLPSYFARTKTGPVPVYTASRALPGNTSRLFFTTPGLSLCPDYDQQMILPSAPSYSFSEMQGVSEPIMKPFNLRIRVAYPHCTAKSRQTGGVITCIQWGRGGGGVKVPNRGLANRLGQALG